MKEQELKDRILSLPEDIKMIVIGVTDDCEASALRINGHWSTDEIIIALATLSGNLLLETANSDDEINKLIELVKYTTIAFLNDKELLKQRMEKREVYR